MKFYCSGKKCSIMSRVLSKQRLFILLQLITVIAIFALWRDLNINLKKDKNDAINKEVVNKDVVNKEMVNKEVVNKEMVNKEVVKKEVVNKKVVNKDVVNKEVVKKEVVNKKVVNKDVVNKEVVKKEVVNKEVVNKKVVNKEVVNKKVVNKKVVNVITKQPNADLLKETCSGIQYPSDKLLRNNLFSTVHEDDNATTMYSNKKIIPKIIHQMYKSTIIPKKLADYIKSWMKYNPGWTYVFWTDADIESFVQNYYTNYYPTFVKVPKYNPRHVPFYRSDMSRYLILDFFGGAYADLDVEAVKSLDNLRHHHMVIGREPSMFAASVGRDEDVQACNHFMMSVPGHAFWPAMMSTVVERVSQGKQLIEATGPLALCSALRKYQCSKPWSSTIDNSIFLSPSPYFYKRLAWMDGEQRRSFMAQNCKPGVIAKWRNKKARGFCEYFIKHRKLDWSNEPADSPVYALHHGKQMHHAEILSQNDTVIDIHDIINGAKSYRDLLPTV